jgi:predicted nucleotidyltransferase component of viral defense system
MSLFDKLVDEALKKQQGLSTLRVVVEKELLHHDILRVLSNTGMLARLTFIGGTCLRACYGSNRLSEDLDFTGGEDFSRESLSEMSQVLIDNLKTKYGLQVEVSDPTRDEGKVNTWKIKVQTRPDRINDLPAQRINIDVCAIASYQVRPMMLLNLYGVEMGTSGLILQAESREEIFADKLVAFALRPNRIKYRDLWDIAWLHQQAVKPQTDLIPQKLQDHHCQMEHFLQLLDERQHMLQTDPKVATEFRQEMRRFLPAELVKQTSDQTSFWSFLTSLMDDLCTQVRQSLTKENQGLGFKM